MKTMWEFFFRYLRAPLENIPGVKEYIGTDEGVVSSLLQVLMKVDFLSSRGNTPGVPGGWSGGDARGTCFHFHSRLRSCLLSEPCASWGLSAEGCPP